MQIFNRHTGAVIFECGAETMKLTLDAAIEAKVPLHHCEFSYCDLTGSDFRGCDFTGSNFTGSDFTRSDFTGSDFNDCNFTRSNFTDCDFTRSDFSYCDLTGSDFTRSDFSYCDLTGSDFRGCDFNDAKEDFIRTLSLFPSEVLALRDALRAGTIDGSQYEGECCCLKGTIAKAKGVDYHACSPDASAPAERLFLAIRPGDTPDNHPIAKIVDEWIAEWLKELK